MAAYYDVVDSVGGFVSTFAPYRRLFTANVNFLSDPMFLMWVKTGYSTSNLAASVRVNGREIGKLFPRPWVNHSFIDFEAESLIFQRSFLSGAPFSWTPVINVLDIVAVAGPPESYVLVDKVLFFRNAS